MADIEHKNTGVTSEVNEYANKDIMLLFSLQLSAGTFATSVCVLFSSM